MLAIISVGRGNIFLERGSFNKTPYSTYKRAWVVTQIIIWTREFLIKP
jgi:hypothetical protein